ncbi:MAG: polysaccharide deacetylase family protein [bacterium]
MRILHVLSQFEVTGAETYATTLAEQQLQRGHTVFITSDNLTLPTQATYIQLPIGKRAYRSRWNNYRSLRHLIHTHRIDLIHAHSRAASWVSFYASKKTRTPFISTIHGRQHLHLSSKTLNIYGKSIIAVCESVRDHLVNDLGFPENIIRVIPNGIAFHTLGEANYPDRRVQLFGCEEKKPLILFIGRLTGPKGEVVRFLLSEVMPALLEQTDAVFGIIGGMIIPDDIAHSIQTAKHRLQEKIIVKGFQRDLPSYIASADIIIGSGRVVPESIMLYKSVVAFGETNYLGPVTPQNFQEVASTNFGDIGRQCSTEPQRVISDLASLLDTPPTMEQAKKLRDHALQRFDIRIISSNIEVCYRHEFARIHSPRSIPVLMYHRIISDTEERPSHGTWITAQQFEHQLNDLRKRNYSTITFRNYSAFLQGQFSLPLKPLIITFDDGFLDNYTTALPLLKKFNSTAVIFVVTGAAQRRNIWDPEEPQLPLLSSEQLRDLASNGIEIGSHTVSHSNLTYVDRKTLQEEITQSKNQLEQTLGTEVLSFAYPYGAVNTSIKQSVEEAGYAFAAAADSGPITFYDDFFEIRRTQIFPWTTHLGFWKKTNPWYTRYKSLKS